MFALTFGLIVDCHMQELSRCLLFQIISYVGLGKRGGAIARHGTYRLPKGCGRCSLAFTDMV